MIGDIIYVERKPLLWRSTKLRANEETSRTDLLIYRTAKYRHYGIDVGNGEVVHFQSDSVWTRSESKIIKTSMTAFLKDGHCGVVQLVDYAFSREEVVFRALSMVGTNFGGYRIISNNCEDFANWCATGYRRSNQTYWLRQGYVLAGASVALCRRPVRYGLEIGRSFIRR